MKTKKPSICHPTLASNLPAINSRMALPVFLGVLALVLSSAATAQTAINYQGRLQQNEIPADGDFEMNFELHDTSDGSGTARGSITEDVTVSDGLFTVELDFDSASFDGDQLWLRIGVREDSGDLFTYVTPLQPLTPAPYAVFALNSNPSEHSHSSSHNNCIWIPVAHASDGPRESFCPAGRYTAGVRANETSDNEADITNLYCCNP